MSVESRRAFLTRLRAFYLPVLGTGGGAYGYGSLIERHRLVVERQEMKLALGPRAPLRLRVVTLSDFHFDPLCEEDYMTQVVQRTNELKPDVVLLTGDYITSTAKRVDDLAKVLGGLRATAGVFGCLGNHDTWRTSGQIVGALVKNGVSVLRNTHVRVPCAGGEVCVVGLDSAWSASPNWLAASKGLRPDEKALLMMHEPDMAPLLCYDKHIAIQFSGHTHGGQVRVPGYGALRLPPWGKKFQAGLYNVKGMPLYVNRGVGTIGVHVRFLGPPEIACFDITNTATALV